MGHHLRPSKSFHKFGQRAGRNAIFHVDSKNTRRRWTTFGDTLVVGPGRHHNNRTYKMASIALTCRHHQPNKTMSSNTAPKKAKKKSNRPEERRGLLDGSGSDRNNSLASAECCDSTSSNYGSRPARKSTSHSGAARRSSPSSRKQSSKAEGKQSCNAEDSQHLLDTPEQMLSSLQTLLNILIQKTKHAGLAQKDDLKRFQKRQEAIDYNLKLK